MTQPSTLFRPRQVYQALCPRKPPPKPRHATLRTLYDPNAAGETQDIIDPNALVLYFPAPETATGENVLELHVHGGTAVVKAVLAAISRALPDSESHTIRYAESGEFTRRAFYNNRLDLLQIEALGDTLSADTEQQRRLAVKGSTGSLAERYEGWRQQLLYARGELEALIDFSEDQHFDESPAQLCESVTEQVQQLKVQVQASIDSASRGELLRNGISIALVGAPNAGKSSLLNQIVGREAAIVSKEAGTTRDIVDVNVDIGGFFCKFGDLAGLRRGNPSTESGGIGEIEQEGMRRAKERALSADVVIALLSPSETPERLDVESTMTLDPEVRDILEQCDPTRQKIVFALNKSDLFIDRELEVLLPFHFRLHENFSSFMDPTQDLLYLVSCKCAQESDPHDADPGGIQALLDGLKELFTRLTAAFVPEGHTSLADNSTWAESLGASERQRLLLEQCLKHLKTFLAQVSNDEQENNSEVAEAQVDIVLAAESLRSAADCLAKITGRGGSGDVEEVLGVVFAKFCVGK